MGGSSRDLVEYARNTFPAAGDALKDPGKASGLIIVVAGAVSFVLALVNFVLGQVGLGITALIVALMAAGPAQQNGNGRSATPRGDDLPDQVGQTCLAQ
jgi:hypothetical protein